MGIFWPATETLTSKPSSSPPSWPFGPRLELLPFWVEPGICGPPLEAVLVSEPGRPALGEELPREPVDVEGSEGIEDGDEDELGSEGMDGEDEDDELGIEGADGVDGDEGEELGIDGIPPLLLALWVDSQALRTSTSAEAPTKVRARAE